MILLLVFVFCYLHVFLEIVRVQLVY